MLTAADDEAALRGAERTLLITSNDKSWTPESSFLELVYSVEKATAYALTAPVQNRIVPVLSVFLVPLRLASQNMSSSLAFSSSCFAVARKGRPSSWRDCRNAVKTRDLFSRLAYAVLLAPLQRQLAVSRRLRCRSLREWKSLRRTIR
jgi:hypothetical protein